MASKSRLGRRSFPTVAGIVFALALIPLVAKSWRSPQTQLPRKQQLYQGEKIGLGYPDGNNAKAKINQMNPSKQTRQSSPRDEKPEGSSRSSPDDQSQASGVNSVAFADPRLVDEQFARLDRMLQLRDGPHNETLLDNLLQDIKPLKTIRRLDKTVKAHQGTKNGGDSKQQPPLSVEVQSDCWIHGRWAVFTSIAPKPTRTVEVMLEQNWCVVVIGDVASPKDYLKPEDKRFVYLSLEDQMRLPFKTALLTPTKKFCRKNLGFLFAMSQGAKVIFDVDDDNEPIPTQQENGTLLPVAFSYGEYDRPYLYKESLLDQPADIPVWNVYPYFNLRNSWGLGFPWEYLPFLNETEHKMTKKQWCLPIIQQYMVNLNPDFDAAQRIKFDLPNDYRDGSFKRIVLPRNVFSPYNAQASIHLPKAFWSMMLPTTVDCRMTDKWRSYIAQSLFHLIPDACIMFTSPAVKHTRNPHNYTSDFVKELPLYSKVASAIQTLRNLPLNVDDFPEAFLKIYEKLYETGVVEINDYLYAEAWLSDLQQIGVFLPKVPGKNNWMRKTQLCMNFKEAEYVPEVISKYTPLFQSAIVLLDQSNSSNRSSPGHNISEFAQHWPEEIKPHECDSRHGLSCLRQCLASAEGKNVFYMAHDSYFNFARAEETLAKETIWFSRTGPMKDSSSKDNISANDATSSKKSKRTSDVRSAGQQDESYSPTDCAFIPQKFHAKLMEVMNETDQQQPKLLSGVAITLALNRVAASDEKYQFDPDMLLTGKDKLSTRTLEHLLPKAMHLHPVMINHPAPRAAWRDALAKQYARLNACNDCQCCDNTLNEQFVIDE